MGVYLETARSVNKALQLISEHGAEPIDQPPTYFADIPPGKVLICVVQNPGFDAAAVCYDEGEFREFTNPRERRMRSYLLMTREQVIQMNPSARRVL